MRNSSTSKYMYVHTYVCIYSIHYQQFRLYVQYVHKNHKIYLLLHLSIVCNVEVYICDFFQLKTPSFQLVKGYISIFVVICDI